MNARRLSRLALSIGLFATLGSSGCNKSEESVTPDAATAEETTPSSEAEEAPAEAEEASPAMIAGYQAQAQDVYGSDATHCLEAEMEAEETRYMRSAYTLNLTIDRNGVPSAVAVEDIVVQVRNYEGEVLRDGNGESMGTCLLEAAKAWEFEPAPPTATSFTVSGSLGD